VNELNIIPQREGVKEGGNWASLNDAKKTGRQGGDVAGQDTIAEQGKGIKATVIPSH